MMAREKRNYTLIVKINKLIVILALRYFLKEIENTDNILRVIKDVNIVHRGVR